MSDVDLNELRKQRERSRREREEILKKKLTNDDNVILQESFVEKQAEISLSISTEKRERDFDKSEQFQIRQRNEERPSKIMNLGLGLNQNSPQADQPFTQRDSHWITERDQNQREDFIRVPNQSTSQNQEQRNNSDPFILPNLPRMNFQSPNAQFDGSLHGPQYNSNIGNKNFFPREMKPGRGRGGDFHRGGGIVGMTEYQKGRAVRSSEGIKFLSANYLY